MPAVAQRSAVLAVGARMELEEREVLVTAGFEPILLDCVFIEMMARPVSQIIQL